MTPVERILEALTAHGCEPRRSGEGWSARCPAHDDRKPSLSINEGREGRAVMKCHANIGCKVDAICTALGVPVLDLFPTANMIPSPSNPKTNGHATNETQRIAATYDYHDEARNLVFQVVRYEPKDFRQRRPTSGGWEWSVQGVRVLPYHLPELMADPTSPVVVVEGEKDADNLSRIGMLATCNAGGAGKWTAEHSEFLRGRRVFIVPDNDEAGRNHAEQVARSLHGIAESVCIVNVPGLPPKGDASDWIAAGGTKGELYGLAKAAADWQPTASNDAGPVLTCLASVEPRPVSWLWPGRFPIGRITLLAGRPGEGKSLLTTDVAARVTTGTPWPDGSECPQGSVILISAEDDPADTIRPRLDAHQADVHRVHLLSAVRHTNDKGQHEAHVLLGRRERY